MDEIIKPNIKKPKTQKLKKKELQEKNNNNVYMAYFHDIFGERYEGLQKN